MNAKGIVNGEHININKIGGEEKAQVEYAPYQKVPKPDQKSDHREGTIDNGNE